MNYFAILLSIVCLASLVQLSSQEKVNRWRASYKLKESRRNRRRGRGKKGRPGAVGPPGNPGPPGLPGRDGQQGSPGVPGETGLTGDIGLSGNRGLKGQKGGRGDKGDRGTPGTPGQACFIEKTDVQICMTPPTGPEGPQGIKGDPGSVGEKGDPGTPGNNGAPGERGLRGPPGRAVDAISSSYTISGSYRSDINLGLVHTGPNNRGFPLSVVIDIRCHTRHNKLMVGKEQIADNLEDLIHAHCDPLQFLQGMKIYKDTTSVKLVYTCCSFY